jgi:hypothetical protein
MWKPRRLTTLWASTACYRDSCTLLSLEEWGGSPYVRVYTILFPWLATNPGLHMKVAEREREREHRCSVHLSSTGIARASISYSRLADLMQMLNQLRSTDVNDLTIYVLLTRRNDGYNLPSWRAIYVNHKIANVQSSIYIFTVYYDAVSTQSI